MTDVPELLFARMCQAESGVDTYLDECNMYLDKNYSYVILYYIDTYFNMIFLMVVTYEVNSYPDESVRIKCQFKLEPHSI